MLCEDPPSGRPNDSMVLIETSWYTSVALKLYGMAIKE